MTVSVDTIRRVYIDEGFLEIAPWPDSPEDTLVLRTVLGESSEGWFGPIQIILSKSAAEVLGETLVKASAELEAGE